MFKGWGEGYFIRDPELQELPNTVKVNFSLACQEYMSNDGEKVRYTHIFDFVAYDSGARSIHERCKKGDRLMFVCRPRKIQWETAGQRRSKVVFRVEEFRVIKQHDDANNVEGLDGEEDTVGQ